MRAPTRVCEKRSPKILPPLFFLFSLLPLSCFLGSFFFPFLPVYPPSFFFFPASFAPSRFPFFSYEGVIQDPKASSLLFLCCKYTIPKRKNALFCDFFTLWGNIDPYTNRGRTKKAHPILQISFTAEANLIYISLDFNNKRILLLIAPPNERWRAEAPATKLRCLR